MLWTVDRSDPAALHEQLAADVRRAIADGAVTSGERLPPARDLALAVEVNANTVLQAYRTLRAEGLVEFRRGQGVRVCPLAATQAPVVSAVLTLLRAGRRHGYDRDELLDLVRRLHAEQAT